MHITNELIHNPGVNEKLDEMGVNFVPGIARIIHMSTVVFVGKSLVTRHRYTTLSISAVYWSTNMVVQQGLTICKRRASKSK